MCLPDVSITSVFYPSVLLSFTRCITTPWIFVCTGFSAVVQYGQSREIQTWEFLPFILSERSARVLPPKFLGFLVVSCLSSGFVGIFMSLVPCLSQTIIINSWKDCIETASNVPESLVSDFCYFLLVMNKVSGDIFFAIQRAHSDGRLY